MPLQPRFAVALALGLLGLAGPPTACSDGTPTTFPPPRYPPPATGACASGCAQLRSDYAEAVLRLQRCTPARGSACGFKAPGHLGCGACEVWVNDVTALVPLARQFNDLGCYGCFYGGDVPANRCHPTICQGLIAPMCHAGAGGQGSCTNDETCPAGVTAGAACIPEQIDTCAKGSQYCYCSSIERRWVCQ